VADEANVVSDGTLFYVNHAFERQCGMEAAQLLGRRVSQLFAKPGETWCDIARRAALENETVAQRTRSLATGRTYHVTASPVIHPGYCGFTVQDVEGL
jgi:PAS domain S-box-containing protein